MFHNVKKIFIALGSYVMMLAAGFLLGLLRISKPFLTKTELPEPQDDIFIDSRAHPLPPVVEKFKAEK